MNPCEIVTKRESQPYVMSPRGLPMKKPKGFVFPDECGKSHEHDEESVVKSCTDLSKRVSRNLSVNKLFIRYFWEHICKKFK